MKLRNKKIVLGFSGGVDSAIAGYLLKKKGYQVKAVFLKLWKNTKKGEKEQEKTLKLAQKLAQKLEFQFQIVDAQNIFYKTVVQYYLKELKKGKTPNPCFVCNPHLKIDLLLKIKKQKKADYIATGHYVRITKNKKGEVYLWEGKDKLKDQSYFLAGLSQEQLSQAIFPLGNFAKEEIKKMAKQLKLDKLIPKKESQELCFLEPKTEKNFLRKNLNIQPGNIINTQGEKIGKHQGLNFYTLGQRKGIGIGGNGPYYVVAKKYKTNELVVSLKKEYQLFFSKKMLVENINWINKKPFLFKKVFVKTRYQQKKQLSKIIAWNKEKNIYEVEFLSSQKAITPGQIAVFYDKKGLVLGGGNIV